MPSLCVCVCREIIGNTHLKMHLMLYKSKKGDQRIDTAPGGIIHKTHSVRPPAAGGGKKRPAFHVQRQTVVVLVDMRTDRQRGGGGGGQV